MKLNELTLFAKMYYSVCTDVSEGNLGVCGINVFANVPSVHMLSPNFEKTFGLEDYAIEKMPLSHGVIAYEKYLKIDGVRFYTIIYDGDLTAKDKRLLGIEDGEDGMGN